MSIWIEKPLPTQFLLDTLIYDYFNNKWIYMEELYKGFVIELYSKTTRSGYDLVAIVFDDKRKEFIHYTYANQDTYLPNSAFVDASDDFLKSYTKELDKRKKKYLQFLLDTKKSYKELRFVVFQGKKPEPGTKGFCIWSGPSKYGRGTRLGIKDKDGNVHWADLDNCEIDK